MTTITKQQGLNQVVIDKVQRMIGNKATTVQATIQRLIQESQIRQDYVAPIGVKLKEKDEKPVITFSHNGHVNMEMPEGSFTLHDNAIYHLADKMKIPARYLRELAKGDEWKRALAAQILNEHSGWTERSRVLVRAVGTEVRGILSDSYRRLDSVSLLTAFIEEAQKQGAAIADAHMSDTKIWAETILPEPIIVPTRKNGDVVIFAGARFSNSDYGDGAVDMRAFLLNGACLNGMVRESLMKKIHLGGKLPGDMRLSQETYEYDTKTTVSAIRDLTGGLFSLDNIHQKAMEIKKASEADVDFDTELRNLFQKGMLLGKSSAR